MELALISKFTWIDGFALVIALLGTILYAVEFYVLATKHNPFAGITQEASPFSPWSTSSFR